MSDLIGGADEAGKGALYGPCVIAFVQVSESKLKTICEQYTIKDSKLLARKTILKLYNLLKDEVVHKFVYLTPNEIDTTNLNLLLINKYALAVTNATCNVIYIDCPIHSPQKFNESIYELTKIRIISEHKADLNHYIVALASIFAKAKREIIMMHICKITNVDVGSGYPSDPKTKHAYKFYFQNLKKFCRNKWQVKF